MKFIPPVRRIDRGRAHYYSDGDGKHIPGVTTILGAGIPKPQLIDWAANATAEAAVDRWDEYADMPVAARLKALQRARYDTTNTAKNRGTQIHGYAEALVQGKTVTGIPDALRGYTESYVRFIDAWQLDPVLVEVVVVHYGAEGGVSGYAGTLDLVAEITSPLSGEREVWLMDIKTGEKGIYAETALQLAAYRFAQFYVDQDGNEQPMVPVYGTGAIHVTPDEATLIPTVSDKEQFTMFRIAQKVYEFVEKDKDGLILPELRHPEPSKAHIVWGEPL